MKVLHSVTEAKGFSGSCLTIGNFDGIHAGHQVLISRTIEEARARSVPAIVMTFDPHPLDILAPEKQIKRLFPREDQKTQIENLGVDVLVIEPFSRALSEMSPEEFLKQKVFGPFSPEVLLVGHDFNFGAKRAGNIDFLQQLAADWGFKLKVIPAVRVNNTIASSTEIRKTILSGEMEKARELLGRPFYLTGVVEKGDGRGRQIGFPTANLKTVWETLPAKGVYATRTYRNDKPWNSVTNVGDNPTFVEGSGPLKIETHLLDFSEDLYGETLRVEFLHYLRPERKFPNKEELVQQIRRDVEKGRTLLEKNKMG